MRRFTFCFLPLVALLFSAALAPPRCEAKDQMVVTQTVDFTPLVVLGKVPVWTLDLPKEPLPVTAELVTPAYFDYGLFPSNPIRWCTAQPRGPPDAASLDSI